MVPVESARGIFPAGGDGYQHVATTSYSWRGRSNAKRRGRGGVHLRVLSTRSEADTGSLLSEQLRCTYKGSGYATPKALRSRVKGR